MNGRNVISEGNGVRVADIPWSSALAEWGLGPGMFAPGWNVSHPEAVQSVVRTLVDSGSSVVVANTKRANRGWLPRGHTDDDLREWNHEGVRLALEAAAGRALVFGCLGTTGRPLASRESTVKWLRSCFQFQVQSLADAGVDAILVEGMADLSEARLAVEVAKSRHLPVVATMKFDSGRFRDQTIFGMTVELAAAGLVESGADAVGVSGGWGLPGLEVLVRRLRRTSGKPVWVRIDQQRPPAETADIRLPPVPAMTPESLVRGVEALAESGAAFLAGGADTDLAFIRALNDAVRTLPVAGSDPSQSSPSLVAA